MKKFIIIAIIILFLLGSLVWYVDHFVFPTKIKSFIVTILKEETGKEVLIENLHFSIFRGLVFRDLSIHDGKKVIFYVKEGSCGFLLLPFSKKKIVVPVLNLKAAELLIERDKKGWGGTPEPITKNKASDIQLLIYKIRFIDSRIIFNDKTREPGLTTTFDKINLTATLFLPTKVRFSFYSLVGKSPAASFEGQGEYRLNDKMLSLRCQLHNFSAGDFKPYYQHLGITLPEGLFETKVSLMVKDNILNALATVQGKNVLIEKDKVKLRINAEASSEIRYHFKDKKLTFSGKADLIDSRILNFGMIDEISGITGRFLFKDSGIDSEKLKITLWGVTLAPRIKVENLSNPEITAQVETQEKAPIIEAILREKFKFHLPFKTVGPCRVSVFAKSGLANGFNTQYTGFIDFQGTTFQIDRLPNALESVQGKIEFDNDELRWPGIRFNYAGKSYRSQGTLKHYTLPTIELQVSGDGLYIDTIFKASDQALEFLRFSGRYGNSKFSLFGEKNSLTLVDLDADLNADLDLNCQDLEALLPNFKAKIIKARPEGLLHARVSLKGRLDQFLSWELYSKVTGPFVSAYGLKGKELTLLYAQKDGMAELSDFSLSLYDGVIRSQAKANLKSESIPYWLTLQAENVKLDQLAKTTGIKQKDIGGTINGNVKINGFSNELSKINGAGKIFITQGNLWQLNLFQGLGSLLFTKDFAKIVFTEGYCSFLIEDKSVFTDHLVFKSTIANLYGPIKVSFGGQIDGSLTIEILDANAPLSGTFKDVTTAVIGRAGRFGVLKVSGSVKDPKYKFKPAVGDIFKGIKDSIIH